jgi:hypothetical protein
MDRALFDAVRQKSLAQWSHRTTLRNKSDHLLTGLLFDDAAYRMIPTHAAKAGIRYRYYVSTPFLHGEAKTASSKSYMNSLSCNDGTPLPIIKGPPRRNTRALDLGISPWLLFVAATIGAAIMGFASWRLVERPCHDLKKSTTR